MLQGHSDCCHYQRSSVNVGTNAGDSVWCCTSALNALTACLHYTRSKKCCAKDGDKELGVVLPGGNRFRHWSVAPTDCTQGIGQHCWILRRRRSEPRSIRALCETQCDRSEGAVATASQLASGNRSSRLDKCSNNCTLFGVSFSDVAMLVMQNLYEEKTTYSEPCTLMTENRPVRGAFGMGKCCQ